MKKDKLAHLLRLFTIALMLVAVAANRDGRLLGTELATLNEEEDTATVQTIRTLDDGTIIVNTTAISKDVQGYGGPTPLSIYVKNGIVTEIKAEKNNETPDFFNQAFDYLSKKWQGKRTEEIMAMEPDGVTGATMSSNALTTNMRRGLTQLPSPEVLSTDTDSNAWTLTKIAVLLVAALGCVLPLFQRFKKYRTAWLCVNVVVLGLWGGTFLSHALFVNWLANGTNLLSSLALVLMLVAAFIYPLFGKKSHYCTWICPLGSLQDLAGKANKKHKWHMSQQTAKRLTQFNELLWAALMLTMLTGVWFDWMDYELFTAFLFTAASPVVIAVAVLFVILSAFVPRPYCRFVCPTGCLLRLAQKPA